MEQPIYILLQQKKRAIIPKAVSLLILSTIFYLGILLNINLLELKASEETTVKLVALMLLLCIIILGLYLAIRNATTPYYFYPQGIQYNKKFFPYTSITSTVPHADVIDKFFHTSAINLGNKCIVRHIPQEISLQDYLEQLRQYAARQSSHPQTGLG